MTSHISRLVMPFRKSGMVGCFAAALLGVLGVSVCGWGGIEGGWVV